MSIDPHQADPAGWLADQRRHAPRMLKRLLACALADAPLALLDDYHTMVALERPPGRAPLPAMLHDDILFTRSSLEL